MVPFLGLLRRQKMLPAAEGASDELWRPDVRSLKDANEALSGAGDSPKRFSIAGTRSTPAGVHLRKIVAPIAGKTVDRLPGPASTLFSSLVNVFGDGVVARESVTRWLELLLELVYADYEGLTLVPEAHATRVFRTMGCFVKVRERFGLRWILRAAPAFELSCSCSDYLLKSWVDLGVRLFRTFPHFSVQCDYSDAQKNLADFKAKYPNLDVSTEFGDTTGELLRCFCKMMSCPEGYMFSPAPPSRSRARMPGEASASSSQRDEDNPWREIHSRDKGGRNISNPVVLLALCLSVDHKSSILSVYDSRARTDITGRSESVKRAFKLL